MTNHETETNQILDSEGNPITEDQLNDEAGTSQSDSSDASESNSNSDDRPETINFEGEFQRQIVEAENKVLRAQAELDNFRKRTRREMEERAKFASLGLMNDLLASIDNLQLAIQSADQSGEEGGLLEGVRMVADQLIATLAKHGCEKIEAVGQPFDPNIHEAVQMQPNDETPANHVSMEVRTGYKLHDRVIRPTQVFVSTGPAE